MASATCAGWPDRWEFELNQIQLPGPYDGLPPVDIVSPEQLFDGDVFLFCASRFVPDTAVKNGRRAHGSVRLNRDLAALYAKKARQARYKGLFCVVSDPVDPPVPGGADGEQPRPVGGWTIRACFPTRSGASAWAVMHARALYYARRDPRFASYLTEGRGFGPHGEDLVLANSIAHYDDALSRELTEKVAHANLEMREAGL